MESRIKTHPPPFFLKVSCIPNLTISEKKNFFLLLYKFILYVFLQLNKIMMYMYGRKNWKWRKHTHTQNKQAHAIFVIKL